MVHLDLPFPNGTRSENNTSILGFRLGRRKRTAVLLLIVSTLFVLWFNSSITRVDSSLAEGNISTNPQPKPIQNQGNHKYLNEEETNLQEEIEDEEILSNTQVESSSAESNPAIPQHYNYFIVVGSRAQQQTRRQLIRDTYFGLNDNIEPCMKRDKGLGYLFYVYGEEPTPMTAERRLYETEKIEYNDLLKVDTDKFDQDQVLKWAETNLRGMGITFDYLIIQDGYSIINLNYIQQQIQSQVSSVSDTHKLETDLLWVSRTNNHQTVLVVGTTTINKILEKEDALKLVIQPTEESTPLANLYYDFYHAVEVQLRFITEHDERNRLRSLSKDSPYFIQDSNRFQIWTNVIETLPESTIAVSNIYQDKDFISVAKALNIQAMPLCNPLNTPHIAVLTSSFIYENSCMEPSAALSANNKRDYAMKHNYAFVGRSTEFSQQQDRTVKRRPVWGKIDAVQKVLSKYDWIFWMDMDAVILDQDKTVQGILDELRNRYEDGPKAFERTIDLVIAKPTKDKMINAGVFFMRNTEWSQRFLNRVQETTEWFNRGPSYEQGAMWDVLRLPEFRDHVMLLENDDHTFNTFPTLYIPGDFVVHFAPDKCPSPAVLGGLEAAEKIKKGETVLSLQN